MFPSFIRWFSYRLIYISYRGIFLMWLLLESFPPSPEGLFSPGAAAVMGLGEAWSVSTSGAEQDRAPTTHQPQCYCLASQRPTPGARQWRRCSKRSQEWGGQTKIVHLAPKSLLLPRLLRCYHHQLPENLKGIIKIKAEGMSFLLFLFPLLTLLNLNSPFLVGCGGQWEDSCFVSLHWLIYISTASLSKWPLSVLTYENYRGHWGPFSFDRLARI